MIDIDKELSLKLVSDIKVGSHCMLNNRPCLVRKYQATKPDKKGRAKATIVGLDIFTSNVYEATLSTADKIQVPELIYQEYQVLDIDQDEYVNMLLKDGTIKNNLKLPREDDQRIHADDKKGISEKILIAFKKLNKETMFCKVLFALGCQKIVDFSIKPKK